MKLVNSTRGSTVAERVERAITVRQRLRGLLGRTELPPGDALVIEPSLSWNYTTVLNFVFLALAGLLLFRAWRTGGFAMLGMMNPKDAATTRAETAHHH